jgi:hypothetical protein
MYQPFRVPCHARAFVSTQRVDSPHDRALHGHFGPRPNGSGCRWGSDARLHSNVISDRSRLRIRNNSSAGTSTVVGPSCRFSHGGTGSLCQQDVSDCQCCPSASERAVHCPSSRLHTFPRSVSVAKHVVIPTRISTHKEVQLA